MSDEPARSGAAGAQRWADYLDWVRAEMVRGVLALSYDAQRRSLVPSGWTPLELLNHVLHMEQRWFVWGFLAEPVAEPWGDWSTPEPWTSDDSDLTAPDARWAVPDSVTAGDLADAPRGGRRTHAVGAAGLPALRDRRAGRPVRRRPADAGVDLLPRARGVRPSRRAPRHRGGAVDRLASLG